MSSLLRARSLSAPAKQLLWFHILYGISTGIYVTFYAIVLLRDTDSVAVPFIDTGLRALTVFISFIVGSMVLRRVGYLKIFQINALLITLINILIALYWPNGLDETSLLARYPYFALLSGLGLGAYWSAFHYINVHILSNKERTFTLHTIGWVMTLLSIILVVLGGVAVTVFGGIRELLILSSVISFVAVFVPWRSSGGVPIRTRIRPRLQELRRRPRFYQYLWLLFLDKAQEWLQMTYGIIIPFLILQSELQTGIFLGTVGLLGAIIVYLRRHYSLRSNIRFAWGAQLSRLVGTLALVWVWTPLMLALRSVILVGADIVSRPVLGDLEARIKQDLLDGDTKDFTVALNLVAEIITFIARVFASTLVVLVAVWVTNIDSFVRISWAFVAGISILSFGLQVAFWKLVVSEKTKISHD